MLDVLCIVLTVVYFGTNVAFAEACGRLMGGTDR